MSNLLHCCETPERNKIVQFARMGLMPSKFKESSYLPYTTWKKSTDGKVEIDAPQKDRLSSSDQKKYRRWSRRLNGQNANGSGWVLKDGDRYLQRNTNQSSSLQEEYSLFFNTYQEVRLGPYNESHLNCSPQSDYPASSSSGSSSDRFTYPEELQESNSTHSTQRKTSFVMSPESKNGFFRQSGKKRYRLKQDIRVHNSSMTDVSARRRSASKSYEQYEYTERNESSTKGPSLVDSVNVPMGAAMFFGHSREKLQIPSSEGTTCKKGDCSDALPTKLHKKEIVEKSKSSKSSHKRSSTGHERESCQTKDEIANEGHQAKCSTTKKAEETPKTSALKSSRKAIVREQRDRTPVGTDTLRESDLQDATSPRKTETPLSLTKKVEETHSMAWWSSPNKGDIKPKALIKSGLRSGKKDSYNVHDHRERTQSCSSSKKHKRSKSLCRNFVQSTLDSFFSVSSPTITALDRSVSPAGKPEPQNKTRLKNNVCIAKESCENSTASETNECTSLTRKGKNHVRRIFQNDEQKLARPYVRLTLLKRDKLWKVTSNSAADFNVDEPSVGNDNLSNKPSSTSRLAEVTPISSPTKRSRCVSPVRVDSPPSKLVKLQSTQRESCNSPKDLKQEARRLTTVNQAPSKPSDSQSSKDSLKIVANERSPSRSCNCDTHYSEDLKVSAVGKLSRRDSDDSSNDPKAIHSSHSCTIRSPSKDATFESPSDLSVCLSPRLENGGSLLLKNSPAKRICSPGKSAPKQSKSPAIKGKRLFRTARDSKTAIQEKQLDSCDLTRASPAKMAQSSSVKSSLLPFKAIRVSPMKVARRSPLKMVQDTASDASRQSQEDEVAQAQRDEAARQMEADQAAQRNKKRHSRGLKVFVYCDVLQEQIERHPVQNEIPDNKWYKWLNPSQLRCLTLTMLRNKDMCLNYSLNAERCEAWEATWVELTRRLNTVCYSALTKLNTGLRMTVLEWKTLWMEMKATIRGRLESMKPEERVHSLGSLECLIFSEDLYNALMGSNGECLGKECPRIWCSGACVGVLPPPEPIIRRLAEE